jgi:hypothetical protein
MRLLHSSLRIQWPEEKDNKEKLEVRQVFGSLEDMQQSLFEC